RGLDWNRGRHRGDHLGGEGLAAAPFGLPRRGRRCRRRAVDRTQSPAAEGSAMNGFFASFAERFARIPKMVLFGTAALIQVALLGAMVFDRVQILRGGTEVKLQTRPVDPRDLLRGDYVVLGYDISQLPSGALLNPPASSRHPSVCVKLTPNRDSVYEAVSVHAEPVAVASPEVLIRGSILYGAT